MGVARAFRAPVAAASLLLAGTASSAEQPRDPWFGEALFHAHQGHYFEALQRLDTEIAQFRRVDEPELDSLFPWIDSAEFSVGDFELQYRMHHRAGRAIRAVLEADVPEPVRNDAAYRLARIHFQKGQPEEALRALDGIRGVVPEAIRDDVGFLRANVYMALGRTADAVELLRGLHPEDDLEGFTGYNLGIALLREGRVRDAVRELDGAGRVGGRDPATLAIRDRANLTLGTLLFEGEQFDRAQRSLNRVRLTGPFSNQALLRAGWADASAENYERALVPWSLLADRGATDAAVQEALLALPYAYGKLDIHGRAAVLYGQAVETFDQELQRVDASIGSIRSGEFLEALVRPEIREDADWVVRLRELPDAPETFYLLELMASHDFQTALQNYLDLEGLRTRLVAWQRSLGAFLDLIEHRRRYYDPLLPGIDREFRKLDARMRLRVEQRDALERRLRQMLVAPRPDLLATGEERALADRLGRLEEAVDGEPEASRAALRARIERLRGVLIWQLRTRYHERLTLAHQHLRELNQQMETLETTYERFVRTRQAATHSYVGYETPIRRLGARVAASLERLAGLMERQGRLLERVATEQLLARRERLEAYQNQARFAFADSYDRAAKAQARADTEVGPQARAR